MKNNLDLPVNIPAISAILSPDVVWSEPDNPLSRRGNQCQQM